MYLSIMKQIPLAERMRPKTLADYAGQHHLVGPQAALGQMIRKGEIPSMILWGPPGVGKTTLAEIVAHEVDAPFYTLSAVSSGVKEVREVIADIEAKRGSLFDKGGRAILFIDEIHRFSKSQQDSLLAAVERGIVTLIGATTENPSFEVIRPLLSRCQVYVLKPQSDEDLMLLARRAIAQDTALAAKHTRIDESEALLHYAGGDARKLYNILDLLLTSEVEDELVITNEKVRQRLQENPAAFDKGGELHYDIASAFIKSIRGSDPDAAIYWLARLIDGGEEPSFIARHLIISAAEDIGLANPNAMLIAIACAQALDRIGWPEGRIPLAEATIYLATSEKSNSAYLAIDSALEYVRKTGNQPVPLHLRNAPTKLMADLDYGRNYRYAHDYAGHFVAQQYLPDKAVGSTFWQPQTHTAHEAKLGERMQQLWHRDTTETDTTP